MIATVNRILNVVALAATITVNALANALPINGHNTGEVSNRFDVYFTPAGYVFSIWGVIYLALLAFCLFQFLPTQKRNLEIDRISPAFWFSCIANISWIFLWHYEFFGTTLAAMLALLCTLIWIWRSLARGIQTTKVSEMLLLHAPFSLYLGWISVATIANLTVVLEVKGLRPFDMTAEGWAVAMVVVGGLITVSVAHLRRDIVYLAVVIWAFVGIAVARDWAGPVGLGAIIFGAVMFAQGAYLLLRKRSYNRQPR